MDAREAHFLLATRSEITFHLRRSNNGSETLSTDQVEQFGGSETAAPFDYMPIAVYRLWIMQLHELQKLLEHYPHTFPRFVLPNGDYIPAHAHVTEVGHVVRNFIDCGGMTGKEEKVVLQTHVGSDTDHRLRSDRFAKILQLGQRVLPGTELQVDVEYNCCVVSQYPIAEVKLADEHLDLILQRRRTQCREHDRRQAEKAESCCSTTLTCC
jgi:hypothetical protein